VARFLLTHNAMGSVIRHWRWLACSALAVGCLLNPQPDLPQVGGNGDNGAGSSSISTGAGGASTSSNGAGPGASAGGPATVPGGFGGAPLGVEEEGGMGGALELPAAGATGESGAAGAPTLPALGTAVP